MKNDRLFLHQMYNATSTIDPQNPEEIESYESWLEKELLSHIHKLDALTDDPQIEYHLNKVKAIKSSINEDGFMKEKGNLMCRVMIRAIADKRDGKGNIVFQERELFNWFENGDYLKQKCEADAM